MKCIALVVMMALAAANAGEIKISPAPIELKYVSSYGIPGYGYPGYGFGGLSRSLYPGSYYPSSYYPSIGVKSLLNGYPVASVYGGFKALPISAYSLPSVYGPSSVAVDLTKPTYVASTPGETHVAPLPGHTESIISENLLPAPGTF